VRTNVGIVGAGPAGLTLALLLHQHGIGSVVLEARDRDYVQGRVRAGLLEHNTVDVLRGIEVTSRLDRESLHHSGVYLRRPGRTKHVDIERLTGHHLTIYGQQEMVKDLIEAAFERGVDVRFEVSDVVLEGFYGDRPAITFTSRDGAEKLECDFIAGCDGFHGVSRASLPAGSLHEYDLQYPFDWLGILAEAAPATDELIYAWHERGYALYSMRSSRISRLYIQVPTGQRLEDWPDERIWQELQVRLASEGWAVNEGPVLEKGLTPMRSYVCEPLSHGRLFLAGDAAHIVPPTGAKGLNLAVNDVRLLSAALAAWYRSSDEEPLASYSERALRRVWRAQDFSNYMTNLLHDMGEGPYIRRLQLARLEYLERSEAAETMFAENYVGLPATADF
jgi:p-hydroxybenzoate 3-monooxygenase